MYALLQAAVVGVEVKARNPILPEGKEILWAAVGFIIIFAVLAKLAFPAVKKALKAREDHIRADLEAAEASRTEAEQALEGYRLQLAEARTEAGRIIEEARQAADQVRQDLMRKAEDDARVAREQAGHDIQLAAERATADLQNRVAQLSIELAEKVVERNLDRETQHALIESYINSVGSN